MKRPSAAQVRVARQLHAAEAAGAAASADRAEAAGRVIEKIFRRLVPLVGKAASSALFARCMTLTAPAFPCLAKVNLSERAESPGARIVLCLRDEAPATVDEAPVALCACLLGLLSTLIGPGLGTLRRVRSHTRSPRHNRGPLRGRDDPIHRARSTLAPGGLRAVKHSVLCAAGAPTPCSAWARNPST